MKLRLLLIMLVTLTLSVGMQAQRGVCGLSSADDDHLADLITAQKKLIAQHPEILRNADPIFVPIRFHPVAETNGSGVIRRSAIVQQLKVLNDDFAQVGMTFYLDRIDWVNVNNTTIFTNPTNTNLLVSNKVGSAVNVFITENADTGSQLGGTTLGFYSRQGDYVVSRKQELQNLTNTLSHELGHFFSLPHTHRGWDSEEYEEDIHGNPLATRNAPNGQEAERADRSNCETAADMLCDTREDYNFGFSNPNNCLFSRTILDFNGDACSPDENNQMGYFSACPSYVFSPQQIEMMLTNHSSNDRNYLQTNYVPVLDEITERVDDATPNTNRDEIPSNKDIVIDWADIEGATHYLLEIEVTGSDFFEYYIVEESTLTIDELPGEERYSYRIYPFNETQTTLEAPRLFRFTTPAPNSIAEVAGLEDLSIYPNPVSAGTALRVNLEAAQRIDAQVTLTGIDGRRVYSQAATFAVGTSSTTIATTDISAGLYILAIETEDGVSQRKVMVN